MKQKYAQNSNIRIRSGGYLFFTAQSVDAEEFKKSLSSIDTIMNQGRKLKDSRSTTAAICKIPGCGEVFAKRTNNKGLRFVLRYLFRPARAFRAAKACDKLYRAGIETPEVLAFGERRFCRILLGGYIINELKKDVREVHRVLENSDDPGRCIQQILETAGVLLASIHLQNVVHRDFKLANIYFKEDGTCGVWDLDGARVFSSAVPRNPAMADLARLTASIMSVSRSRKDNYLPDLPEVCRNLASSYSSCSSELSVTGEEIESALQKFFPKK